MLQAGIAALAAEQSFELGGTHVAAWLPGADAPRAPLLIFSHGLHGCSTQSGFLMQALADAGYAVFAPDHRDSGCGGGADLDPQQPLREPERWSEATYRDRADDVRRLIAFVSTDSRYASRVDATRIGLIGHSLGGYTVLGLAGAWHEWRLPAVKAVLALSPYVAPYLAHHTLSGIDAPVMYQGGTQDLGITPTVRRPDGAYDRTPPPKYYVELDPGGHFAWTDVGRADRDSIIRYCRAFLDQYLRGERAGETLREPLAGVAAIRYETEAGSASVGGHGDARRLH
jgi:predicted dienelactone hydrolase